MKSKPRSRKKQTLHVMKGLPGSGKSTKSNALLNVNHAGPISIVRINRDCLRKMLWPEAVWSPAFEDVVKFAEKKLAGGFYDAGIDVIIDDTNLAKEQIADYVVADRKVVHDFTHVDVEECLRRNEQRRVAGGNWCSPDVIVKLARKHGLL